MMSRSVLIVLCAFAVAGVCVAQPTPWKDLEPRDFNQLSKPVRTSIIVACAIVGLAVCFASVICCMRQTLDGSTTVKMVEKAGSMKIFKRGQSQYDGQRHPPVVHHSGWFDHEASPNAAVSVQNTQMGETPWRPRLARVMEEKGDSLDRTELGFRESALPRYYREAREKKNRRRAIESKDKVDKRMNFREPAKRKEKRVKRVRFVEPGEPTLDSTESTDPTKRSELESKEPIEQGICQTNLVEEAIDKCTSPTTSSILPSRVDSERLDYYSTDLENARTSQTSVRMRSDTQSDMIDSKPPYLEINLEETGPLFRFG